jgi:hypothetical protein
MTTGPLFRCGLAVALAAGAASGQSSAFCEDKLLDQGWDCRTQSAFWYTPQGSTIMPYAWFTELQLLRPDNTTIGMKDLALSYGYIQPPTDLKTDLNPGDLPIGFAKDELSGKPYVGMTCAACHTAEIVLPPGKITPTPRKVIVNGGPSNADFFAFLDDIVTALRQTANDATRTERFANRVKQQALRLSLQGQEVTSLAIATELSLLEKRVKANRPTNPYGRGRVDAFSHIFNQVVAFEMPKPDDAPVSYPFLWLTHQMTLVQWNASASNEGQGRLLRNIGEALGVFGRFTTDPGASLIGYWSTMRLDDLRRLESWVETLRPPRLPDEYLDPTRKKQGQAIYGQKCLSCHPLIPRSNPPESIKSVVISWGSPENSGTGNERIATDPVMTKSFLDRGGASGKLAVDNYKLLSATVIPQVTAGASDRGKIVLGAAIVNSALGIFSPTDALDVFLHPLSNTRAFLEELENATPRYKAPLLNGVWATAPYLHNGSVATIDDLLRPRKKDQTFCAVRGDFDPALIGFQQPASCPSQIDTAIRGNGNQGHFFGTDLEDLDRKALIEFLKSL